MGLFGKIVATAVNVATLPVAVVKDVLTLGGTSTKGTFEPSVAEIDAAIPDLLLDGPTHVLIQEANRKIREAYRRGHKSKEK